MTTITYTQALNDALREEMRVDSRVFLMGEDIGHHGGIFRVTKDLITEFGPERVRDTPISESGFVGLGIGAAMTGMRPVVELLFMDFALVAADQIINQAAKLLNVPAQKLYYATRVGLLKAHRKGAAWVIHIEDLKGYQENYLNRSSQVAN